MVVLFRVRVEIQGTPDSLEIQVKRAAVAPRGHMAV